MRKEKRGFISQKPVMRLELRTQEVAMLQYAGMSSGKRQARHVRLWVEIWSSFKDMQVIDLFLGGCRLPRGSTVALVSDMWIRGYARSPVVLTSLLRETKEKKKGGKDSGYKRNSSFIQIAREETTLSSNSFRY